MPVTAKLSKAFYDRMGDDVANELVNWFNSVDTEYRTDLRELNELNFARFDAKLEQRIAELRAELREEIAALGAELRGEIGNLRQEIGNLRTESRTDLAGLRADLSKEIAASKASLMKWMFVYWAGTALAVIGVLKYWR